MSVSKLEGERGMGLIELWSCGRGPFPRLEFTFIRKWNSKGLLLNRLYKLLWWKKHCFPAQETVWYLVEDYSTHLHKESQITVMFWYLQRVSTLVQRWLETLGWAAVHKDRDQRAVGVRILPSVCFTAEAPAGATSHKHVYSLR